MSGRFFLRRMKNWFPSISRPKSPSPLQRKAANAGPDVGVSPIVQDVVRSPGRPLDDAARLSMETRFGRDFSSVRIHDDSIAAASARAVHARAYTVGQDVVFGAGEYSPQSESGRRLMAHELAHTVQQSGAAAPSTPGFLAEGKGGQSLLGTGAEASEVEADRAAEAVIHNQAVRLQARTGGASIQRQALPGSTQLPDSDRLIENASPFIAAAIGSTTLDGFVTGSAALTQAHQKELAKTAHNITVLLRKYTLSTVAVTGYTDTVGTEANNLALGDDRALAVKRALVDLGVPESIISTDSKGERAPQAVKTGNEVPNAANRRVEVRFQPKEAFGGIMTGKLTPPSTKRPEPGGGAATPPPVDLNVHPKIEPPDPTRLPPDFWKPLPPPIPGTGPKSALDIINEKFVDPVVDAVTKGLPKSVRDKVKAAAHSGVKSGVAKAARAAAEAAGLKDPAGLDAIEKAAEAAIQEKGNAQP
jgi:outer membrane protein OmpA-like peptidoglycan-associated protein